jgi:tripartite-type tricarboxylate transporter receptor subunit TctC
LFAPKGTPENVVSYLRQVLNKAAHTPGFENALANLGQNLDYLDMPEFAAFWAADSQRIEAAIRAIGKVAG